MEKSGNKVIYSMDSYLCIDIFIYMIEEMNRMFQKDGIGGHFNFHLCIFLILIGKSSYK